MPLLRRVIGAVLRRARQAQGRTLRDVADAARVSVQYLSEVERGRKEVSSEVLAALLAALGWTLADLVAEIGLELGVADPTPPRRLTPVHSTADQVRSAVDHARSAAEQARTVAGQVQLAA